MNESTVSSPLLALLRGKLTGSVVFKHADRATIGVPDASVTWNRSDTWLEFKLFHPGVRWSGEVDCEAIAQKHPVQYEVAKRLAREGRCFYVIWVAKRKTIVVWNPYTKVDLVYQSVSQVVEALKRYHTEPLEE